MGKLEIWKEDKLIKEEYIDKDVKYTNGKYTLVKKNGDKEKWKLIKWTHKQTRLNCGISFPKEVEGDELFKTRPGNLVDATPPIQALEGKGVSLS